MLPHAKQCYEALSPLLGEDSLGDIEWHVFGNLCMNQGAYSTAIGCFNLAVKNTKAISSVQRTQTALSLATIYYEQDRLDDCRDALAKIEIHGSWTSDPLLDFRVNFARADTIAVGNENLEEAVDKFDELERTQDKSFGPTDSRTLLVVHRLSSILKSLGDFERAEALYRRLLTSYGMEYGASEPITLEVMEDLAEVLEHKGELDSSEDFYKNSIELKTATLGPEHPNTAASQARLAQLYDRKYEFDEAERLYGKAEEILKRTLGPCHPSYIAVLENHALGYWSRADAADTETGRVEALAQAQKLLNIVIKAKATSHTLYSAKELDESKRRLQGLRTDMPSDAWTDEIEDKG
jgi:tetratricopeptide (TPR) repeat protein